MPDGPKHAEKPGVETNRAAGGGLSGSTIAMSGFEFAGAILLGFFAGRWLDSKVGIAPWGVIVGVFVGAVAGFYSMYRRLMAAQRADDERRRR